MTMIEEQLDIFSQPASRIRDLDTAKEAGNRDHSDQRHAVWQCLRNAGVNGITDDGIAEQLGILNTSAGKRRIELERLGMVERTGERGTTRTGATATKWRAVQ